MQRQRQRTTVTRRTIQRIRQHNDQHRRDQDPKPLEQRTNNHAQGHDNDTPQGANGTKAA
tara:strand:- start:91 stop:270 length:180 start_codon:yes stop_codon:yes gene_type:complete